LDPPEFSTQTASRSVYPFFAGRTNTTDRQTYRPTDRPSYSVFNYVGYLLLRFGLKTDLINTTLPNACSISNLLWCVCSYFYTMQNGGIWYRLTASSLVNI